MDTAYFSMLAHGWPAVLLLLAVLIPLGYAARWADKRAERSRR